MIPTPHIEASRPGQIAPSILLPGDPLRARFIAENFLSDVEQFNSIRNMLGYTGNYAEKDIGNGHRHGDALNCTLYLRVDSLLWG